ncbi:MAG: hypothetical protein Q7T86_13680 [Hyphomicrobiaceae bacterium]|nr:hypothetical protein [Hyphomicrobiaceae bacterium]
MTASTANLWAVAGLVYALAGAALLALSVFAAPQPAHNAPSRDMRRSIEQWLDARIGAALIVAGFFLQATGSIGTATLNTPAIFVLLGLALAAAYYGLTKDLIVEKLADASPHASPAYDVAVVEHPEPVIAPVVLVPVSEPTAAAVEAEQVIIDLRRESTG